MFLVLFGSGPSKRSPCPDQTKSKSSSPGIEWIMRNGKTLLNKGIQKGAGGASVDDRRWRHDGDGGVQEVHYWLPTRSRQSFFFKNKQDPGYWGRRNVDWICQHTKTRTAEAAASPRRNSDLRQKHLDRALKTKRTESKMRCIWAAVLHTDYKVSLDGSGPSGTQEKNN
jgi:hypothetical protein